MRIVVALGGNALLRRGQPLNAENQRRNIRVAAGALAPIACKHDLVVSHGNGPQVGLLALQGAAYKPGEPYPLDVLGAETEGMIGYMIEQELGNLLPAERRLATLLTQVEVDPMDPAFKCPTKPIGPQYSEKEAKKLALESDWSIAPDGEFYRRVVPSPLPKRIFELEVIELLISQGVIVICAGGGGIPTVHLENGSLAGVEAVIDKDLASSLLARELKADAFIMLTDADALWKGWGEPDAKAIRRISPEHLGGLSFAAGSMAPKVEAAIEFVNARGGMAGIGRIEDAEAILLGEAGTVISRDIKEIEWWE